MVLLENNSAIAFNNFQNDIRKNICDWLDKSVDCDVNTNYDIF